MTKKRLGLFLFAGLLIASALVFLPNIKSVVQAEVGTGSELRGWMWSSDVGWISVNSADRLGSSSYSVKVKDDQTLEGYAWSPNLGWLRFGSDLTGTPGKGDNWGAKIVGNNLTGWARFCSVYQSGCTGPTKDINGPELGGWDGWVKMINVTKNPTTGGLFGYAWGALNVGWISFGKADDSSGCPVDLVGSCCPAWGVCPPDSSDPTPVLSCSVSPNNNTPASNDFIWTASLTDVSGSPTFTWNGDSPLEGETGQTVSLAYSTNGTKYGSVSAIADRKNYGPVVCKNTATIDDGDPTPCTISRSGSYGISLVFSPLTRGDGDFYYSTKNEKLDLKGDCPEGASSIVMEGLPSGVDLICKDTTTGSSWEACSSLNTGTYLVGVKTKSKTLDPDYYPVYLKIGGSDDAKIETELKFSENSGT